MRPLVYSEHAYTIAFTVALLLWVIPERIGSFWWRARRDPSAHREDRGSTYVLLGAIAVGAGIWIWAAMDWRSAAIPWLRPQVTIAGIVMMLLGTALRFWAIVTLGRYFTIDVAVRSRQPVVQTGPYRLVRHPSYSGLLLIMVGMGVALANWVSLIVLPACVMIGLLYRVRVEERALVQVLGQPYVDYMRRTKRFIPFVY